MNHMIKEPTQSIVFDHGIRHDLRNLIACLGLDVELLSRLGKEDDQKYLRNAGARAMKSMQRIEALLLNVQSPMLVRSDFDQDGKPIVSVRGILTDVIEALEPVIPRGMRIRLGVAPTVMVEANPLDVFRIILNLLRNAIDVALQGGKEFRVRITGATIAGMTSIMIRDNGPGLPAAVQRHFELPVKTPQKNHRGRGQGLIISRYLAQINRGRVRISSTSALGTAFEIVLPAGAYARSGRT